MSYSLQIGLRYLRSKKRSTLSVITVVAVTGVALGVAALLAILSITSGFQDEFRGKVLGVNAHVIVLKYGLDFSEYGDVIEQARKMPEVAAASPFMIHEMMLAKGDRISGVLVKGIDPDKSLRVLDVASQLRQGSLAGLRAPGARPPSLDDSSQREAFDSFLHDMALRGPQPESANDHAAARAPKPKVPSPERMERDLASTEASAITLPTDDQDQAFFETGQRPSGTSAAGAPLPTTMPTLLPGVVVGVTLASNLGLHVGDVVKIVSPIAGLDASLWAREAVHSRVRDFRVTGIFEAGFQEYDTRLVYVDLYESQRFFDQGDVVTGVEVRLRHMDQAPRVARRIERALGGSPFHTLEWQELNRNLFTALEIQKIMLSLVIATIIVVAAFNVIATLILMVLEKRREIAILKAMGAADSSIVNMFFVQGTVVGLLGTAIGLVLGAAVCAYLQYIRFPLDPKVYLINHLPIRTSTLEFVLTAVIALGICMTASLIPSLWAARLVPMQGIRYR
jgi:lipoprotein-releasing system permease protein